jgi:hypothetical protein
LSNFAAVTDNHVHKNTSVASSKIALHQAKCANFSSIISYKRDILSLDADVKVSFNENGEVIETELRLVEFGDDKGNSTGFSPM